MNPLILPFLKEVLHAVMETDLVSTWLDHLVEGTPTNLDNLLLEVVRNVLGVEDRDERDAEVAARVSSLQRMYDTATPEQKAELKAPFPVVYALADIPGFIGYGREMDSTG